MRSLLRTILQYRASRPRYVYYVRYSGASEYKIRIWIRIIAFILIFFAIISVCSWWSSNVFPLGILIGYNQDLGYVLIVILAIISWFLARLIK